VIEPRLVPLTVDELSLRLNVFESRYGLTTDVFLLRYVSAFDDLAGIDEVDAESWSGLAHLRYRLLSVEQSYDAGGAV